MAFKREMLNVVTTLGGSYLAKKALSYVMPINDITWGTVAINTTAGVIGGYLGNLVCSGKTPEEKKKLVRDRAVGMLLSQGISKEEATQFFDKYYTDNPKLKPEFARNFGNTVFTLTVASVFSPIGLAATTALCTSIGKGLDNLTDKGNTKASYGFVVGHLTGDYVGMAVGGYLGNKLFQGPARKAIDMQAVDIVSKILEERNSTQPIKSSFSEKVLESRYMAASKEGVIVP